MRGVERGLLGGGMKFSGIGIRHLVYRGNFRKVTYSGDSLFLMRVGYFHQHNSGSLIFLLLAPEIIEPLQGTCFSTE